MFLLYFLITFLLVTILTFLSGKYAKYISTGFISIILIAFSIYSLIIFNSYRGNVISYSSFLISSLSIHLVNICIIFSIGLTGFTDILVIMSLIVTLFSLLISSKSRPPEFFGLLMASGLGLVGVFVSRNLLFFYIFWEIVLIPVFFIISKYGTGNHRKSSLKFFIYTHIGSLFMLLSIFTLSTYFYLDTGLITFQFSDLLNLKFIKTIPVYSFYFIIFGFLLSFLIKLPSFPVHTWLPDAHFDAPYPGTVMLSGGLLAMGGYGFFGILEPVGSLFPKYLIYFIILLGLISVVYFSFVALMQEDLKKMAAYASITEMAFVTISFGTALLSHGYAKTMDIAGGMYQLLSHALVNSFMLAALLFIKKRTGTVKIYALSGIYREMPLLATFLLISMLASLGLPSLPGFIGEFSVTISAYQSIGMLTIIMVIGLLVTSSYFIWAAQRTLFGPFKERLGRLKDANRAEIAILGLIFAVNIFFGIYPTLAFKILTIYAAHLAAL
ncbi:NADH-quinone oxidoreductase subunit M [Ferroplasma sp.]|uniref:NADH-quinone oxidoreductase subunit M n=1 Tax=Ferroplasma sp. TaxID=2591003 RepID=UPI00307E1D13